MAALEPGYNLDLRDREMGIQEENIFYRERESSMTSFIGEVLQLTAIAEVFLWGEYDLSEHTVEIWGSAGLLFCCGAICVARPTSQGNH